MAEVIISDGRARRIASEWHGGQDSPLYAFTSTGAIQQPFIGREIRRCLTAAQHDAELPELLAYVEYHGERGPQAGWSDLWEEPTAAALGGMTAEFLAALERGDYVEATRIADSAIPYG